MVRKMLFAAGTMLAASSAQAQVGPYPPPQPYVPYAEVPRDDRVFSGLRAEIRLSYDRLSADLDDDDLAGRDHRDGLGYGGEIGFDLPLGGVVLGGYAGIDGSTVRDCSAVIDGTLCFRPGRNITAGARIGVPVSGSVMLYAKGGYTNGQLRGEFTSPTQTITARQNLDGFHVGGGVEVALAARAYGKLEYVYTRLRDRPDDQDFTRQQVQAGVGLRF